MKAYILLHAFGYDGTNCTNIECVGCESAIRRKFEELKQEALEEYKDEINAGTHTVDECEGYFAVSAHIDVDVSDDFVEYSIVEKEYLDGEPVKAHEKYTIDYESRYGFSMTFDEDITNRIVNVTRSDEDAEAEWDEMTNTLNKGEIDDFGTDIVCFQRWFGCDEEASYSEGDTVKIPTCVKSKADEIMEAVIRFLEKWED